jgi:hypothetical protein
MVYPGMATAVIDPLLSGLTCLGAGQLKILKDNLQHLEEYTQEDTACSNYQVPSSKFKIIFQKIQQCAKHHNSILE